MTFRNGKAVRNTFPDAFEFGHKTNLSNHINKLNDMQRNNEEHDEYPWTKGWLQNVLNVESFYPRAYVSDNANDIVNLLSLPNDKRQWVLKMTYSSLGKGITIFFESRWAREFFERSVVPANQWTS